MNDAKYIYANSRIKVLETRLLNSAIIERLLNADRLEEVIKILNDTDYKNYFTTVEDIFNFEENLGRFLKDKFKIIEESTKTKIFEEFFTIMYDYQNAKALLKAKYLNNIDLKSILSYSGNIDVNQLKKAIDKREYSNLTTYLINGLDAAEANFNLTRDPQQIDIILDKAYFKQKYDISLDLGYDFIIDMVKTEIDLNNIRTYIRSYKLGLTEGDFSKNLLDDGYIDANTFTEWYRDSVDILEKIEFTKYSSFKDAVQNWLNTNSPSYFEKKFDNYMLDFVKSGKMTNFGIMPIIGYLYSLINETKNLRIIFVGKLNEVPKELIEERLRDMYV